MSILIKGIDMPTHCDLCDFIIWDSNAGEDRCFFTGNYTSANYDLIHGNCPLIPVPTPHGRLIDADALMAKIEHDTPISDVYEKTTRRYMQNAPTIIEAEGR